MKLWELIGEWRCRTCYAIDGTDFCIKSLKPLVLTIKSLVSHMLWDMNQTEFKVWDNLPDGLKSYFADSYSLTPDGLVSLRPKDFDGAYSKTLKQFWTVDNIYFWACMEELLESLIQQKIWLLDIFTWTWKNILVQRISEDKFKPVIVDCKKYGWRSFPLQFNLLLDSEKAKKMRRRFKRLRQER